MARASWRSFAVVLAASLSAGFARAETAPTPPRYPVPVRFEFSPATLRTSFVGLPPGVSGPRNPSSPVAIGEQARDAYRPVAARMFGPEPAGSAAAVGVRVVGYDVELGKDGWFAYVEHELVLGAAGGAEIARWTVRGEGRIVGFGPNAIPDAFARAAEYAAATFEAEFQKPPAVVEWLRTGNVPLPPPVVAAVPRLAPTPPPVVEPRSPTLLFAEIVGSVLGQGGGAVSTGAGARVGWSGARLVASGAVEYWSAPFVAWPQDAWGSGDGTLRVLAIGPDVAARMRLGPRFEVHAGAGGRVLLGSADVRYTPLTTPHSEAGTTRSATAFAGSVFAAARWNAVVPRTGTRCRLGLELRKSLGASVDLGPVGAKVEAADLQATVLLGLEWPWGGRAGAEVRAAAPVPTSTGQGTNAGSTTLRAVDASSSTSSRQ